MEDNLNNLPGEELQTEDLPATEFPEETIPAPEAPEAAEPAAPAPAAPEAAPAPGISFGGGANNDYIRRFAESPQYGRTLEEIEQDEMISAGVSEETRERYRAQAKRRMAETESAGVRLPQSAPKQQANPGWRIGGKVVLVDPLDDELPTSPRQAPAQEPLVYPEPAGEAPAVPQQPYGYVQPIAEEEAAEAPAEEAPPQSVPKTGFQRLFSTKKNFAVFTVIAGAINILWEFLYFVTLANRSIVMSATESTLISQGQTSYTIIFESPMIGLLKFFMFLLPLFAVIWAILFKKADAKKYYYNRKIVIFFLCLIALAMIVAVVDLTALHLLG